MDVPIDQADAFAAFADGERYAAWLGVPVTIRDRHFRATLEWGTQVRGTYEIVHAPELIAMRWDFDDDAVPVPGRELVAYLRVSPTRRGSRVEVHQLAGGEQQAAFLTEALVDGARTVRRGPRRRRPHADPARGLAQAVTLLRSPRTGRRGRARARRR